MDQTTQGYVPQQPLQPGLLPPKNWLVESILVTLFCCLPFGIAGIIFATQVNTKFQMGDHAGAQQASSDAAKWTKIGFFVGLAVIVLYILAVFAFGLTAFWSTRGLMNGNY
ncbi:MAG: CD225/dispanin family protein [Chitinophagaceae bacterium]